MRYTNIIGTFLLAVGLFFFAFSSPAAAFTITSDPQYIVINFSDTFHFLDWTAPEAKWESEVKPQAIARLERIKSLLTMGSPHRKLAWSTLMEYMNYPADTPSTSSPYAVRLRRILELAEEENFPVFVPLNGVQWWDEMPALWNWWDYDGNQTPGCTNANYSACPFTLLRDSAYRKRFIAGYNPANKWNVDWSDWNTPMKFGIRNWGSGDIYVAPSPNISTKPQTANSFIAANEARYQVLLGVLTQKLGEWQQEKKQYLFAGMSIGTEITLNGALLPGDSNFKPFGFRAVQDFVCPPGNPTCGAGLDLSYDELTHAREDVIHTYTQKLAYDAYIDGIPKERVYTHVWSEADPGELRYMDAIGASVGYFSRPGMSIYGKATDPMSLSILKNALVSHGYLAWAAPEFAPLTRDAANWDSALVATLDYGKLSAKLVDVYNETDILNTPAIPAIRNALQKDMTQPACFISETQITTPDRGINAWQVAWRPLQKDNADTEKIIIWQKDKIPDSTTPIHTYTVSGTSFRIPQTLENGYYYFAVQREGCNNAAWTISTPHILFVQKPLKHYDIPWWVWYFVKKTPSD